MPNDPIAVVNRQFEDVINAHRPDLAHEVFHPRLTIKRAGMQGSAQYLGTLNGSPGGGLIEHGGSPADPVEAFKSAFAMLVKAFPDMRNNVVGPQVAVGDLVITHVRFSGTHEGEFFGVPPTHRSIEFDEVLFMKVTDGKISEVWAVGDELSFLQQLGVLPSPQSVQPSPPK